MDTIKYVSIETLLKEKTIDASIRGLGGYSGDCMQIAVKNNSPDSTFVWIEGGRRLASEDESEQDIFIAKSAALALAPGQVDSVTVFGFCCQAKNHAPKRNSKFSIGAMAPLAWVVLARFIEKNEFPKGVIQKAVWVMSDDHDLGTIHHEDKNLIAPLKKQLAKLKGIPIPWYSFTYTESLDGESAFSGQEDSIFGDIPFSVNSHCPITAVIKNKYGENMAFPVRTKLFGPGDYVLKLKQKVLGWEPGAYVLWIMQDYSGAITRRTFIIK